MERHLINIVNLGNAEIDKRYALYKSFRFEKLIYFKLELDTNHTADSSIIWIKYFIQHMDVKCTIENIFLNLNFNFH